MALLLAILRTLLDEGLEPNALVARLNGQVDERLLDAVITRVLAGMK